MNDSLKYAIYNYLKDTKDPVKNLKVAEEYLELSQYASSISFYLRCANLTNDLTLQYECLMKMAYCFVKLPYRGQTTRNILYHCINLIPNRPEAYFFLSRSFEWDKLWNEGYVWANLSLQICDFSIPFIENIGYSGKYNVLFEKAVCGWWVEKQREAENIFKDLTYINDMDDIHRWAVYNNLRYNLKIYDKLHLYSKENKLKISFPNIENIDRNYSETFQDLFVLAANKGQQCLKYLEIGAAGPVECNNTYLLENKFDWKGISIDYDKTKVDQWKGVRKNKVICVDALTINYTDLLTSFSSDSTYGYLQIDCEPPDVSFKILLKIPFNKFKFAAITFEHDYYQTGVPKEYRELSRNYLKAFGYVPVIENVSSIGTAFPYEDWYIHPDLVDINILKSIINIGSDGVDIHKVFLYD